MPGSCQNHVFFSFPNLVHVADSYHRLKNTALQLCQLQNSTTHMYNLLFIYWTLQYAMRGEELWKYIHKVITEEQTT